MKKIKFSGILLLLTPSMVSATEYMVCGNDKKIAAAYGTIFSTLFSFVRIIVPILFVITGIIAFLKATAGKSEDSIDKAKGKLIHNAIAAAMIFFIVSIINFVISLVAGSGSNFSSCLNCMVHPNTCTRVNENGEVICTGMTNGGCDPITGKVNYGTGDPGVVDPPNGGGGTYTPGVFHDNPYANGDQIISKKDQASGYNYYIYVPKKVDNTSSLPLIVYLHGNGTECGYTYDLMVRGFGFAKYIDKGMEFNTYILMPQKHDKSGWNTNAIKRIMDEEVKNLGIDPNRISVWGYSAGAEAVPYIVNSNPDTFASAVILAKGYDASISGFKNVKTYAFYSDADGYANPATPDFVKKLQKAGYTAYSKAYTGDPPKLAHDLVMEHLMYDNDIGNGFTNIMDWVLAQRR